MLRRFWTRVAGIASVVVLQGLTFAPAASAHALVGKQDLPIPRWLFAWSAAIVLIVSFVALATLWQQPRLQDARDRVLLTVPRVLEPLAGLIGVLAFAVVVYSGLAGEQNPQANIAPLVVFSIVWVGVPFASVLFGDVFAAFNPWRAIGRATGWLVGRVTTPPEPYAYPERLGRWPAALGLLAFAWVELVYQGRDDPSKLAVLVLVYAGVNLLGMAAFGERAWSRNADAFAVYFRVLSKLSPFHWEGRRLRLGAPGARLLRTEFTTGTLALLLVSIGSTSFDGFSQGDAWATASETLTTAFGDLGLPDQMPVEAAFTVGLLLTTAVVVGLYYLGIAGVQTVDRRRSIGELARAFAPSLVPIAFAYVFAHYFTLLIYQSQALAARVSNPLGEKGTDLFGTAGWGVDFGVISANAVWYTQVAALLIGHVVGLVLAHERALTLYEDAKAATRSQYWMLVVMIGFTSLALWLLSLAAA